MRSRHPVSHFFFFVVPLVVTSWQAALTTSRRVWPSQSWSVIFPWHVIVTSEPNMCDFEISCLTLIMILFVT
jgi:hypothetical protein